MAARARRSERPRHRPPAGGAEPGAGGAGARHRGRTEGGTARRLALPVPARRQALGRRLRPCSRRRRSTRHANLSATMPSPLNFDWIDERWPWVGASRWRQRSSSPGGRESEPSSICGSSRCDDEATLRVHGLEFLHLPTEDCCAIAPSMIDDGVEWVRARLLRGARVLDPLRARHRPERAPGAVHAGGRRGRAAGRDAPAQGRASGGLARAGAARGLPDVGRAPPSTDRSTHRGAELRCAGPGGVRPPPHGG